MHTAVIIDCLTKLILPNVLIFKLLFFIYFSPLYPLASIASESSSAHLKAFINIGTISGITHLAFFSGFLDSNSAPRAVCAFFIFCVSIKRVGTN